MLVRVVGSDLSEVLLEDVVGENGVLIEYQDASEFWADPDLRPFDLAILSSSDLPGDGAGAIQQVRSLPHRPEVVVLGSDVDGRLTVDLMAAGCSAVIPADAGEEPLARALAKLIARRREDVTVALRAAQAPAVLPTEDFVAESPATRNVLRIARRVAVSDTSLLLLGETGSGKEWLARAVHAESPRAAAAFVPVNCGAIPEGLLESELFGHERGAFTGAVRARRGYFEQAHGGTLFLDEIGEMPPHLQVRLLRVLQDRTIQRLGSEQSIEIDTRVIAATHRDLKVALASGKFREDLYYRLAVVTLTMPPLRERIEDIPALSELYLRKYVGKFSRSEITGISDAALEALVAYSWPGNVRELMNVIERGVLLCEGTRIDLGDLPAEVAAGAGHEAPEPSPAPVDDLEAWIDQPVDSGRLAVVEEFERRYFTRLLGLCRGNVGRTAERAGVDPRTLYNKMRQLGLRKEDFRG